MNKTEASPASGEARGTQEEKRVSFTRPEFIDILTKWEHEVKKPGEVLPFIDSVFNGQVGVIVFDAQAKAGERFHD